MPESNPRRQKFESCVASCADSLYRVAFRLTGRHAIANELVQETYLNAWNGLDNLKDDQRMRSWLFAILRNQWKKLNRNEARNVSTQPIDEEPIGSSPPRKSEWEDELQQAFHRLDEPFRLPLLLVVMEGMKTDEVAAILKIPRGTVLSRVSRAKQKLKQVLAKP